MRQAVPVSSARAPGLLQGLLICYGINSWLRLLDKGCMLFWLEAPGLWASIAAKGRRFAQGLASRQTRKGLSGVPRHHCFSGPSL